MPAKLFISQSVIDSWLTADAVELAQDVLTIGPKGSPGTRKLRLMPAFRFLRLASGGEDLHGLLGKVKEEQAILQLGAEPYMNSVILGEAAYDVEPGFLAGALDFSPVATLVPLLRAMGAQRGVPGSAGTGAARKETP